MPADGDINMKTTLKNNTLTIFLDGRIGGIKLMESGIFPFQSVPAFGLDFRRADTPGFG